MSASVLNERHASRALRIIPPGMYSRRGHILL
ncbi:MAG: hypothetical protein QOH89_1944, partial [Pseudonocardiales bacterium]|nr:hypothetical protein [Pseudonocardiales bacterium]